MKVKIDLKIVIFLILFYFTGQLEIYIWSIFFCLVHELGHLFVGYILGFKPSEIEFMPFGFFIRLIANYKDYNKKIGKSNLVQLKTILVAMAGPAVNLLFIIFSKTNIIIYINLVILMLNLIPIFPLDGGRIIRSLSKICFKEKMANKISHVISYGSVIILTVICSIIILYIKNIAILLILAYLWILTIKDFRYNSQIFNIKSS